MLSLNSPFVKMLTRQRNIWLLGTVIVISSAIAGLVIDRERHQYRFQLASAEASGAVNQLRQQVLTNLLPLDASQDNALLYPEDILSSLPDPTRVNDVQLLFDDGSFMQLNRGNPSHQFRVSTDDSDPMAAPLLLRSSPIWQRHFLYPPGLDVLIWPGETDAEGQLSLFLPEQQTVVLLQIPWARLIPATQLDSLIFQFQDQPPFSPTGTLRSADHTNTRALTARWQLIQPAVTPFWQLLLPLLALATLAPVLYWRSWRRQLSDANLAQSKFKLLQRLCEEFNLLLLVTDAKGVVTWRQGTLANDIGPFQVRVGDRVTDSLTEHPKYLTYLQQTLNGENLTYEVAVDDYLLRIHQWPDRDVLGRLRGMVVFVHDMSAQQQLEDQLRHEKYHDSLTGLPNRQLFTEQLSHDVRRAQRRHEELAVLAIEVSGIGKINKLYGHGKSDQLLQILTQEISDSLGEQNSLCRFSNDEFLISIDDYQHTDALQTLAKRLIHIASHPYNVDGIELALFANIGIATYPRDARDAGSLISNAITAMRHARETGRNTLDYFSEENARLAQERWQLEQNLSKAMVAHDFELHYQPIFDLQVNRCIGAEALLRWPTSSLQPNRFIPVAEETGLIHPLGLWVLQSAIEQRIQWQKQGTTLSYLSVNISPLQLQQPGFIEQVEALCQRHPFEPGSLVMEITESVMMHTSGELLNRLHRLRELGFRLAIDDFGTGFSSLSYLKHLPIDILKVDKSFIDGISRNNQDSAICQAIVELALAMDIDIIAEGVETPEQMIWLTNQGVTSAQGYFYTQALPADQFSLYIQNRTVPTA